MADTSTTKTQMEEVAKNVLTAIDRPREKEVIERRFGLTGTKETLESVGETMSITRERVRQIEKATILRVKISLDNGKNPAFDAAEVELIKELHELGRAARVEVLAEKLLGDKTQKSRGIVSFIAELSDKTLVTTENDRYYQSIILTDKKDEKDIKKVVDVIVEKIKKHGKAMTADEMFDLANDGFEHPSEVTAMANISKQVFYLNGKWGLGKWPTVNPKNIRDKIYIVLSQNDKKPMHFSEIAAGVKSRDFKRNNITDQAIHNELIKDSRFVLVGRGIYALSEWGYEKGSITDVIVNILKKEGKMHRDDIVRSVLKVRKVREATILLNLQSKSEFTRVGKGEYVLTESK
jgi:DNA-directed RNA polymerase delta subunit